MNVRYADEVFKDLFAGMQWLDERRAGLGLELESEFYNSVSSVLDRPFSFAPDENDYRPCRLKRFNAVLYFQAEKDFVLIVGLLVNGQDYSRVEGRGIPKR